MSNDGVGLRAVMRSVAFLTAGALAVPALAGCSSEDTASKPLAEQDIAPAARDQVADGGTLHWAVDALPETLNTFQADANATTATVAQAVLPSMYRLDANGRPQVNPDYLESAKVVETEPKQVVLYKLNQQAVWSDGREIGAADFAAQWRALSGKDSAYWTARNAGYERIEKIERGANDLEVRVTFARPYADWRSLFSPLYPKDVMGTPDSFNDSARKKLKVTAGPFRLKKVDRKDGEVTLARSERWWGHPAKLDEIVLTAVPREERTGALAAGDVDLAEIDPESLGRITLAARAGAKTGSTPLAGPGGLSAHGSGSNLGAADALRSWAVAHEGEEEAADDEAGAGKKKREAALAYERQQTALKGFEVRRSLEPAYTQLALNGASGPLADERVRRAVARALDRKALAKAVLTPLGLPAEPVGSHLALSGQDAYADNSGALGGQDTEGAEALLADAGWVHGGPVKKENGEKGEKAAGAEGEESGKKSEKESEKKPEKKSGDESGKKADKSEKSEKKSDKEDSQDSEDSEDSADSKSDDKDPKDHANRSDGAARHLAQDGKQYANRLRPVGAPAGAYAPKGTPAPAGAATKVLAKNGKALALRFVLPSGPGSETLRTVADRISSMLAKVGIRTEISKVSDESYFKDHIASGQYDLALYSWPASAFPATDARPIFAKPVPAADGSLNVEQNYTRVGTDQVDQLFDQAVTTLDASESRSLIRKADSRIWAAAGSIPLYQRPQLTAAKKNLVNAGAFGFQTPVYEDMGFLKKGAKPASGPSGN
ncbi:ABC transporter family substrate-binding protein [Streptomyces griseorubiginosus]|uniref:ABC transporter family substrate-binding protein n=1 Tax=Streptomyces griseorubiginosus TaxID=67304 RepID=UPI0036E07042